MTEIGQAPIATVSHQDVIRREGPISGIGAARKNSGSVIDFR